MKTSAQFFKHKAYEYRWGILSGILVGITYIPFPPIALLFCYLPLWVYASKQESICKSFVAGWWTQFILTLIGFHWIAHTAHEFGQLNWAISLTALLLFCAFMHLYIPASTAFAVLLKKTFKLSPTSTLVVIASLHTLLERFWPVIFDWHLGYTTLWAKLPMYHLADLVGFFGLSGWILLANAALAAAALRWASNRTTALQIIATVVVIFSALQVWGHFHGKPWNNFDREIKANVIQANIGNIEKIFAEQGLGFERSITDKFLDMSRQSLEQHPGADLLVWPETAFPDYLDPHLHYRRVVQHFYAEFNKMKTPMIAGAYSLDPRTPDTPKSLSYNALFLINEHGHNVGAPYRKTELLAFGEYLPLSERYPILLKWFPFVSNFGRGPGPTIMTQEHPQGAINWGGQICYEGLYPNFSRELALKGADVMINVTNDSWFGATFEPHQHLYMTLARAIENRRPLLRSTNTGISTAIYANGEIQQKSPIHQEWFGQFVIKFKTNASTTIYSQYGSIDSYFYVFLILLMIGTGVRHARSRNI